MNKEKETPKFDDIKTTEEWLREEVKNHRALLLSLIQWGVTLLAAVESSLYFVRRDVAQAISKDSSAIPAQVLAFPQWIVGTIFVLAIALLFYALTAHLRNQYFAYLTQLNIVAPRFSQIDDSPVPKKSQGIAIIFLVFPIINFAIWLILHK